jgi:hypothetical protein
MKPFLSKIANSESKYFNHLESFISKRSNLNQEIKNSKGSHDYE